MTRAEYTAIALVVNDAKRAWLEQQGGYTAVERDAAAGTDAERVAQLEQQLKRARNRISDLRRSRDLWYTRATGHPPSKGRGATRKTLRADSARVHKANTVNT